MSQLLPLQSFKVSRSKLNGGNGVSGVVPIRDGLLAFVDSRLTRSMLFDKHMREEWIEDYDSGDHCIKFLNISNTLFMLTDGGNETNTYTGILKDEMILRMEELERRLGRQADIAGAQRLLEMYVIKIVQAQMTTDKDNVRVTFIGDSTDGLEKCAFRVSICMQDFSFSWMKNRKERGRDSADHAHKPWYIVGGSGAAVAGTVLKNTLDQSDFTNGDDDHMIRKIMVAANQSGLAVNSVGGSMYLFKFVDRTPLPSHFRFSPIKAQIYDGGSFHSILLLRISIMFCPALVFGRNIVVEAIEEPFGEEGVICVNHFCSNTSYRFWRIVFWPDQRNS